MSLCPDEPWMGRLIVFQSGACYRPTCPSCGRLVANGRFTAFFNPFMEEASGKLDCPRCGEQKAIFECWKDEYE